MSREENEKPLISVIVPVYNGQDYLEKCIESIEKQTYKNRKILSDRFHHPFSPFFPLTDFLFLALRPFLVFFDQRKQRLNLSAVNCPPDAVE